MFDFFRSHMKLLQMVLLPLVFIAFVLVGVEGYKNSQHGANETIAKVDGRGIKQGELDIKQREALDRMRRQMPNFDAKLFDTPQMKRQVLDELVRERVMMVAAYKNNFTTTNERLLNLYLNDPQFAPVRKPDGSVDAKALETALSQQGMTVAEFETAMRRELEMRQVMFGIGATVVAPTTSASEALDAMFQQREVQLQRFDAREFTAKVAPTDAEIEAYYKANPARFQTPESASIEYAVLDLDAIKKDIKVSEDDLRKYYEQNKARFADAEERRASHILIKADKSAPAEQRAKAKAKAEALLAEVKKKPASFAELARKNSDDPGSAAQGGDLDYFARNAMVKPFNDAAFALKPNQISDVVETDYGYHIIMLTAVRGGTFESVHEQLEDEVKKQEAQRRFSEASVDFTNTVYEQADSLKPVVDKLKLELRTAGSVQRTPAAGATGPLASEKFLEAVFSSDSLRNKRNIEAVEIGPSQLASARVVSYTAAAALPLADVTPRIREILVSEQSTVLARKEGEARLAALRQAPDTALAAPAQVVSRAQARQMPRELVNAILKTPVDKLPAYVGVDLGAQGGYVVAKVTKVLGRDPVAADSKEASAQYARAWAEAEGQSYYASLKKRFHVEVLLPAANAAAPG